MMRLRPLIVTVSVTVALVHYIYTPLPDAIQQPWRLMLAAAAFRMSAHLAYLMDWLGYDLRRSSLGFSGLMEAAGGVVPGVRVSEATFAGVPVRVYEPPAGGEGHLRRGLLYFHAEDWVVGSIERRSSEALSRVLSDELNTVVVSVQYRLYPEVHFPAPYSDCLAAAKHFLSAEVLARYAIDPERVAVSGASVGGNLAAAVAQEISTDDSVSVKFSVQALVYPMLQALDFNTPSYQQSHDVPFLSRPLAARLWLQYLGADVSLQAQMLANNHSSPHHSAIAPELRARVDWTALLPLKHKKNHQPVVSEAASQWLLRDVPGLLDVRASPLLAGLEVLAKGPRAYIVTCENDVLRDDGLMYARRLQSAGVAVTSEHHEDGFHGCFSCTVWPVEFDVGKRAVRGYVNWLHNNL